VINKFKNTKSYLDNFSQELVKLLKIEIGRSRKRRSMNPRGKNITAPIDSSGKLRDSVKTQAIRLEQDKITFNIESSAYGVTVDKGRKADKRPPPVKDIAKWIKAKPVKLREANGKFVSMNDKKIDGLAGVIARSIGFYGTSPTNFISEALEASMGKLDALGDSVGQDVMENVEDILVKAGYIKKGDNYEIRKE
jgi:hypothetical protein